jgi:hypothetical protein
MKQNPNDKASTQKKVSKTLKARIQKHITDKNDVITDDDIKNVKVGVESGSEEEQKSAKELADAIKTKKQTSPWTILSEEDK